MESDTFEKAFSDFIDRDEYDKIQAGLFDMVRVAFRSGWESAGGEPPKPQPGIRPLPYRKPK